MRLSALLIIPCILFAHSDRVEKHLKEMTLEEKVGQLFAAPFAPKHENYEAHRADWKGLMDDCRIGNAIVKQSDPDTQIRCLNELQSASKRPLLILADAEWGLGMRMSDTLSFPRNMTLGAIQDLSLLEMLGREIGRQARLVGIHMNLAPVVDVNNNPKNPVIHMRSFGDRPKEVAERGAALVCGMKQSNLLTCLKHFPGHGDTTVDSHFGLPKILHSKERLSQIEIPPFKRGIAAGADAIMTAHLLVPAYDPDLPATLSRAILSSFLRADLGFEGLIVTDALNMKALCEHYTIEKIALNAHAAGADLLLYGDHISSEVDALVKDQIPRAYRALLAAYKNGEFSLSRLDASVARILEAKESLQLFANAAVSAHPDLSPDSAQALKERLFLEAVTQIGPDLTPISSDTTFISFGCQCNDRLHSIFSPDKIFFAGEDASGLQELVQGSDQVVVSLRELQPRAKNYGLSDDCLAFLHEMARSTDLVICLFGTPYAASLLPKNATILVAYEEDEAAQNGAAKILEGHPAKGILPITIEKNN